MYYPPLPPPHPTTSQPVLQRFFSWAAANSGNQILIIVSALIVACMSCGIGAGIGGSISSSASHSTSQTGNSADSGTAPTGSPRPINTPHPPTATPKPKQWTTIQHFDGSVNQQTPTFHLPDGSRIVWKYTVNSEANLFITDIYNSDGSLYDSLADYANESGGHDSVYNVHGDADVYLNIQADSVNWTIDVQVYQ